MAPADTNIRNNTDTKQQIDFEAHLGAVFFFTPSSKCSLIVLIFVWLSVCLEMLYLSQYKHGQQWIVFWLPKKLEMPLPNLIQSIDLFFELSLIS